MCVFLQQNTAYEMRISDCSSDVCSSDLVEDDDRAGVSDMREVVDRRPADIGPDMLRVQRNKCLLAPRGGIVDVQRHRESLQFRPAKLYQHHGCVSSGAATCARSLRNRTLRPDHRKCGTVALERGTIT